MPERPLHIGISCFPTIGGSGIIATELGLALAERGHSVYFVSYDTPRRFVPGERVHFYNVVVPDYPVFQRAPYALALASKLVQVATWHGLDLIHAHYALPHATSAFLARAVLGDAAPQVITTLHGTDVTLIGREDSYRAITRFSLEQSAAVTAPSAWLAGATRKELGLAESTPIDVIANFVDTERLQPRPTNPVQQAAHAAHVDGLFADDRCAAERFAGTPVLTHISNFRPVKRTLDVVHIFASVAARRPVRLLFIGDGPDRSRCEARVRELGLAAQVRFIGLLDHVAELLPCADLLLMPSETESFGLAALEAASCAIPAVASDAGGLPEVVEHGVTGFLAPVGDIEAFASHVMTLLNDPDLRRTMGRAARKMVCERFNLDRAVDRYEALYRRVLAAPPTTCP